MTKLAAYRSGSELASVEEPWGLNPVSYLSVFFAPERYMMVKITCSYSEVILQTIKHTMVYCGSGSSLEVIALRPVI
jgi:hypothetical protein